MKKIVLALMLLLFTVPLYADGELTATVGECTACADGSMDDNYIWSGLPDNNYGAFATAWAVGSVLGGASKGIWRFDLSGLPAGSSVSVATLGFQVASIGADGGVEVSAWGIHDNNNDWVEGTKTGATEVNSSCWKDYAFDDVTEWAGSAGLLTSGTDFYNGVGYGSVFGAVGARTITLDAAGRTYVARKMGVDGAEFLIFTAAELDPNNYSAIETGEFATAAQRPYLEITYSSPAQMMMIRR